MPIFGSKNGGTAVPCGQRLRFQRKSLLFMRACFPGGNISYLYDRYSRLLCKICRSWDSGPFLVCVNEWDSGRSTYDCVQRS